MADPGPNRPAATNSGADASRNGDLDKLRELLLGPERAELEELREHIWNRSQRAIDLSEVLPEAILLRAGRDRRLSQALQPLLEKALADSVRRDPRILAEALFPIIAGAVRRAVASALQSMTESLNQIVETSVSVRSVGWRLEAARTGKSYAEIALLRSLLYHVEQVFLIQNETGLLLQHVTDNAVVARDPDMVSGMLTAIQNFVQDSFGASGETLETVRVGEFSVWIRHGEQALLAAVIRGTPPLKVRQVFDSTLERIHQDYGKQLVEFRGDATTLEGARPALEDCLLGQSPPGRRASRTPLYAMGIVVAAVLAIWAGFWLRDGFRWRRYVSSLHQEEGIVVTYEERYKVSGLRDPLSRDPRALLSAAGIPASQVSLHWEPYQSLSPHFVALRAFADSKDRLERGVIHFDPGKSALAAYDWDSLRVIAGYAKSLLAAGGDTKLEVVGHTDEKGSDASNYQLGLDRAAAVKSALATLGVEDRRLVAKAAGAREPIHLGDGGTVPADSRSVTFHVLTGSGK